MVIIPTKSTNTLNRKSRDCWDWPGSRSVTSFYLSQRTLKLNHPIASGISRSSLSTRRVTSSTDGLPPRRLLQLMRILRNCFDSLTRSRLRIPLSRQSSSGLLVVLLLLERPNCKQIWIFWSVTSVPNVWTWTVFSRKKLWTYLHIWKTCHAVLYEVARPFIGGSNWERENDARQIPSYLTLTDNLNMFGVSLFGYVTTS